MRQLQQKRLELLKKDYYKDLLPIINNDLLNKLLNWEMIAEVA